MYCRYVCSVEWGMYSHIYGYNFSRYLFPCVQFVLYSLCRQWIILRCAEARVKRQPIIYRCRTVPLLTWKRNLHQQSSSRFLSTSISTSSTALHNCTYLEYDHSLFSICQLEMIIPPPDSLDWRNRSTAWITLMRTIRTGTDKRSGVPSGDVLFSYKLSGLMYATQLCGIQTGSAVMTLRFARQLL